MEFEHLTSPSHSNDHLFPSADRADMAFAKSLKLDPLGIVDTRLTMTESPTDRFFSPLFAPWTGLDGTDERQPVNQTEAEASPKQAHRILKLRESFGGVGPSRKCPRLELDVAVDKYHTLDGLAEPLNPQNTPASNSERESEESTESLRYYKMENVRTSPTPRTDEFNFDCFQDSPEASFVREDNGSESPKPSKLRRLSVGRRQWIKPPAGVLASHQPGVNACTFNKPGDPESLLRCVRFSPPATLSPPSRATRRPQPSIERRKDYVALHRQKKQYQKWKVTGRANSRKSSPNKMPTKITQSLATRIPKNHDLRGSSLSSLPYRETRQPSFLARIGLGGGGAREMRAGNMGDTPVVDNPSIASNTEQNLPAFLAVSFSLYKIQPAPSSSTEKAPKYAFRFRMTRTDLPQQPSPHFPFEFEHITCHPTIDDLVFHTCFIIPALVVLLPLSVIFAATHPLVNTRAGAVMLYLARALLYLLMSTIDYVLSKFGVSCGCQWNPDPVIRIE